MSSNRRRWKKRQLRVQEQVSVHRDARAAPPACASRFGHAFAVTETYGAVTTYPDNDAPAGGSTSYEADEHCTRRGCHVTRHTDGRPASRDSDGNPAHAYGMLPLSALAVKDSLVGAGPDCMERRRRRVSNRHIGVKPDDTGRKRAA